MIFFSVAGISCHFETKLAFDQTLGQQFCTGKEAMGILKSEDSSSLTDSHGFHKTAIFILFFLSLIIALENLLALISVGMFTCKRYSLKPFICSLSLANILQFLGPVVISLYIYTSDRFQGFQQHYFLCKIQSWLTVFLHMTSLLSILMLTVDRNVSLAAPNFYGRKWKGLLLFAVVGACWMLSAFLSSWQLLEVVQPTHFSPHLYCLFTPNSSFAIVFASLSSFLIILCVVSVIYTSISARRSLFSGGYSCSTGKIRIEKTRNLVQEEYIYKMNRMVLLVASLYCVCLLPWMVTIFLGYFNISSPHIFSLLSLQFPMISGLGNPVLYGLVWLPFRYAYINTLKAPLRIWRKNKRSFRSHNSQDSSLTRSYQFWPAEGFSSMTADQQENSLQILFGRSSSHSNQPIDFMPDELRMFENEGLTTDTTSLDVDTYDVTNPAEVTAASNIALENSAQFQNILDLIEEMTAGKSRISYPSKTGKRKTNNSKNCSIYWSDGNTSSHAPPQTGGARLLVDSARDLGITSRNHGGNVRSGIGRCVSIGKSRCYVIDKNRNRPLDDSVEREVR